MAEKVIGKIAVASGEVLIHRDGKTIVAKVGTELLQGDMISTSGDGKAGIAMIDDSRFSLGAKASMKLDELTFNDTTKTGTMTTSVVKGAFMFVTGSIAKSPGDKATMKVRTSTATIAVRGTEVVGEVDSGLEGSKFTLLPNADGHESFAQIENAGGVIVINQPNQTVNVTGFFAPPSEPYQMSPSAVAQTFGQTLLTMNQLSQVMGLPTSVNQATYTPPTYVAPTQIQNDTVAKPASLLESGNPSIDQLLSKIEASKTKSENLTIEQSNAQAINQQQTVFNAVRQLSISELIAIRSSVNSGYVFAETKVVTTIGGNIVTFYAPSFAALTLNIPPSAAADIAAATEIQLTPTRGSVLTNDTDADAFPNALSVLAYNSSNMNNTPGAQGSIVSGQFGSLSIASSGSYTYVIDTGKSQVYNSSTTGVVNDVFNYTISDGSANATSTISFTVDFSSLALRTSLTYSSAFISTSTDTLSASSGDILSTSTVVSGTYDASVVVSNFNTNTSFNALGTNITAGNQITGTYGTLTLNPSGTYEYILDPTKTSGIALGSFVTDDFTYTLSNGQTSNFTIMVEGVGTAGIADLVTYTYRYGDTDLVTEGYQGDYYTGYVYVTAGTYDQYMTGATNANKINTLITENGTQGYYTIDTVTQDQIGVVGLTRVNTYYDTTKGSFVTPYMRGLSGLGSEEGSVAADGRTTGAGTWVYDYANYFFDADLNVVNPANQIQYYTFTYTYGSGEFYTGYGYAASGFTANTTINSSTITGIVGSYYIENVFNIEDTATDNIKVGDVYVKSYHDANGALDDTIVNAVGERGLGSERGNVFSKTTGAADAFDAFSQATISASTSTKELYYFHYEYVAGSGSNDTYYGYGYATAGTYTVNQTLTRTNELGVTGLYTIDAKYSSDVGNVGEVFVTNYYDADHAGWNTTVEGTGSTGLGSEEGNVRNALTGKAADSFSNYYEADVITSAGTLQEFYYHFTYSSGDTYYGYGTAAAGTYAVGNITDAQATAIKGEAGTYTIDAIYGTSFGVAGEVYVTSYNDTDGAGWNTSVTGSGTMGLGSEKGSISNYVGSKLDNFNPGDDATLSGSTTLQTYYFHFTYDTGGDIYYGYGTAAANTYTVGNVSGASIVGEKGTYTIDAVYDSYDGTLGEVQVYSYYDAGGLGWNNTVKASSKTGLGSESGAVFDYNGDSDGFDAANDATISTITNSGTALQLYYYHFTYTSGDTYYGYGYLSYTTATGDSSSPYTSGQTLASVTGAKGTYTIDWVYDTTYGTAGEVQVYSYYDADTNGIGWNSSVSGSGKTGLGSESGTITNYAGKTTGFTTDTEADFIATGITFVSRSATTATITAAAHGYKTGDRVTVNSTSNDVLDGTYTITGVTTDTFTYTTTGSSGTINSTADTGTIADPTLQLYYFHFTYTTGDTYYGYGYTDSAYTSGQTLTSVTGAKGTYTIDWVYDTTYGTAGEVNIYSYYDADTGGVGWDNTVSGSGKTGLGSEEGTITNFSSKSTGFTTASEADFVAAVAGATTALQLYYYHFTYTSGDTYYGYGYLSYTTATTDSSSPYTSGQTLASVTGAKGTYTIDWVYDTTYGTAGEVQVYSYYDADTNGIGWNNTVSGSGKTGLGSESGTITNYKEKSTGFTTDTEADFIATGITFVSRSATTATITAAAHGYKTGDRVTVNSTSNDVLDGTYTITGVTTDTFTYTTTGSSGTINSTADTGTVADPTLKLYYFHFTYTTGDTYYGYGYTDSAYTSGQTLSSSITNVAVTSNVATITTSTAHGFTTGDSVTVDSSSNNDLDGTYTITGAPTTTTFTYAKTATNSSTADTGTVRDPTLTGAKGTYTIDWVYDTTYGTAGEVNIYSYYDADTGGVGWDNTVSGSGKTGLGSEEGTITNFSSKSTGFTTASEADFVAAVEGATTALQLYYYHFTYTSGDTYYGYGYLSYTTATGDSSSPYTSGQTLASVTGAKGTYTIDWVYDTTYGTAGEVQVYSYYDADTGGIGWNNTVSGSGKTGLGSESGTITNYKEKSTGFTTDTEADFIATAITNVALTSNVATITTSTAHGYKTGDRVTVDASNNTFDGTYTITGVTTDTFTYTTAATGTINSTADTGTIADPTLKLYYFHFTYTTGDTYYGYGYTDSAYTSGQTLSSSITNVAVTSNVATITTSTAHGFTTGDSVTVDSSSNNDLDGTYTITGAPTTTTFTYAKTATNSSTADTGTVRDPTLTGAKGTYTIDWVYDTTYGTAGEVNIYSYYDADTGGVGWDNTVSGSGKTGLGSEEGTITNFSSKSTGFTTASEADFVAAVEGATTALQLYYYHFTYTSGDTYYGYGYLSYTTATGDSSSPYTSGQTLASVTGAKGTYTIDWVYDTTYGTAGEVQVYSYYDADTGGIGWNNTVSGSGKTGLGSESGTITNYKEKSTGFTTDTEADFIATAITNVALTSNVATITTSTAHGYKTGDRVTVDAINNTFDGTYTITGAPTTTTFTYAKTADNVTSIAETGGTIADPTLKLYYFHFTYTTGDTYYGYGYTDSAYTSGQTLTSVTGAKGTYTIDWVYDTTYGTAGEVNIYSYYDADTGGVGWDNTVSGSGKSGLGSEEGKVTSSSGLTNSFTISSEADFTTTSATLQIYYFHFTYTSGDTYYGYGTTLKSDTTYAVGNITSAQAAAISGEAGTYTIDYVYDTTSGTAGEVQVYSYYDADTGGIGWNNMASGYGKTGLGSESGTVTSYDGLNTSFSTSSEADFSSADLVQYYQFHFTYDTTSPNSGDIYYGYGYAAANTYAVGPITSAQATAITGENGTYTIDYVYNSNKGTKDEVTIYSYYDTDGVYWDNTVSASGKTGLGSESGSITNLGGSTTTFTTASEADFVASNTTLQYYQFHFTYNTTSPNSGDIYYGYGYAAANTYAVGNLTDAQTPAISGEAGIYTIDYVYASTWGTLNRVSVYQYYDADTGVRGAGYNTEVHLEKTITHIARTGTTATITTSGNHGYVVGDYTYIQNTPYSSLNGYFEITSVTATTFNFISSASGTISSIAVSSGTCNNWVAGTNGLGSESGRVVNYNNESGVFTPITEADFTNSVSTLQYYSFRFTYTSGGDVYYGYGYVNKADVTGGAGYTSGQTFNNSSATGTYVIDYVQDGNSAWGSANEVNVYSYYDADGIGWNVGILAAGSSSGLGTEAGWVFDWSDTSKQAIFTSAGDADLSIASANSSSPAVGTSTNETFTQASSTPTVTGSTGLDTLIFSGLTDGTQNINLANVTGIEKIDLGSSDSTTYNLNINFDDVFNSDAKGIVISGKASDDTVDLITSSRTSGRGAVTWLQTDDYTYDSATGNYFDTWVGIDNSSLTQNVVLLLQQNITVTQVAA